MQVLRHTLTPQRSLKVLHIRCVRLKLTKFYASQNFNLFFFLSTWAVACLCLVEQEGRCWGGLAGGQAGRQEAGQTAGWRCRRCADDEVRTGRAKSANQAENCLILLTRQPSTKNEPTEWGPKEPLRIPCSSPSDPAALLTGQSLTEGVAAHNYAYCSLRNQAEQTQPQTKSQRQRPRLSFQR